MYLTLSRDRCSLPEGLAASRLSKHAYAPYARTHGCTHTHIHAREDVLVFTFASDVTKPRASKTDKRARYINLYAYINARRALALHCTFGLFEPEPGSLTVR